MIYFGKAAIYFLFSDNVILNVIWVMQIRKCGLRDILEITFFNWDQ